jgi:hypothetical protein
MSDLTVVARDGDLIVADMFSQDVRAQHLASAGELRNAIRCEIAGYRRNRYTIDVAKIRRFRQRANEYVRAARLSAGAKPLAAHATDADKVAYLDGYTKRVEIEGGCMSGEFLIQPDADLDGRFKAWGVDWQEWTWVHGSNVLIEHLEGVQA